VRFLSLATERGNQSSSTDTAEEEKEEESGDRLCNARGEYSGRIRDTCASLKHETGAVQVAGIPIISCRDMPRYNVIGPGRIAATVSGRWRGPEGLK
jgi:hypothetical protein